MVCGMVLEEVSVCICLLGDMGCVIVVVVCFLWSVSSCDPLELDAGLLYAVGAFRWRWSVCVQF